MGLLKHVTALCIGSVSLNDASSNKLKTEEVQVYGVVIKQSISQPQNF